MLEELLLSLSGRRGLLFTDIPQTNLEYLHPGEEEILSKILVLGRFAADFQEFVDRYDVLKLIKNRLNAENSSFGYYEAAFAEGLKDILTDYRARLIHLEANFRTTPSWCGNLQFVNSELQEYHSTFPVVDYILDKIKKENIRGCILLNIVFENISTGIPSVNKAFDKIRRSCNRLFAKHIVDWLKYGSVVDKYNEFFIQKCDNDRFILRSELCPNFISLHLIEKLFFIGDKISLLGKERQTKPNSNVDTFSTLLDENCIKIRSILIDDDFDPTLLEIPIERIRKALSEKLWSSIANSTDNNGESLFYCLNLIKDYFFLGKGEFYLALIDEIDDVSLKRNVDLNKILQNAQIKMYGGDGTTIANEVFRMNFNKFDSSIDDNWDRHLDLSLNVSTKLKLIFDDQILSKCRHVFHFLLKIRRVQTSLNKCWTILLKRRRTMNLDSVSSSIVVEAKIWRTNNLMLFLINNLQYYLHVDVLDSFFKILLMELTRSVDEFQRASDLFNEFVRNICVSCFLESKEISKLIDGVVGDCEKFAVLILNKDDNERNDEIAADRSENIQKIFVDYERHASLLFKILSNPKTRLYNPHLLQLLHRLDYNSYFSSTKLF